MRTFFLALRSPLHRRESCPMLVGEMSRYHRQILLPQIGEAHQARLAQARLLLIGCGALGTVVAEQLVRAAPVFCGFVTATWSNLPIFNAKSCSRNPMPLRGHRRRSQRRIGCGGSTRTSPLSRTSLMCIQETSSLSSRMSISCLTGPTTSKRDISSMMLLSNTSGRGCMARVSELPGV